MSISPLFVFDAKSKIDEIFMKGCEEIAVNSQDQIISTDLSSNQVNIFNADGTLVRSFNSCYISGIAIDFQDNIIVTDQFNHRIQVFDVNGKVVKMFGSVGTRERQFK